MSKYIVQDYWEQLRSTSVVVCTSIHESFCNAAFEAMSCGVPVVWQKELHGKRTRSSQAIWEDAGVRCEYTAGGFNEGIQEAIKSDRQKTRDYVVNNCSLKHMRDSYVNVFEKVLA